MRKKGIFNFFFTYKVTIMEPVNETKLTDYNEVELTCFYEYHSCNIRYSCLDWVNVKNQTLVVF